MEGLQGALGDTVTVADSGGHVSGAHSTQFHAADIPPLGNHQQQGGEDVAIALPAKATGQQLQGDEGRSERVLPTDGSQEKTTESIARLPPKLRARLLQRGILKEEDVIKCGLPKAGAVVNTPDNHSNVVAAAPAAVAVPPENPFIVAQMSQLWAASSPEFAKAPPMGRLETPCTQVGQSPFVKAVPPQTSEKPSEPKVVYSSGPVLNQEALKKRADSKVVDPKEQADAKKLRTSAAKIESPADARAAAARAEATDKAPVWVYKDGTILNAPTQESPAKAASPAAKQSSQETAAQSHAAVAEQPAVALKTPPLPPGPPPGSPLPINWVAVPHEGDYYYWNTVTDEVSWEHPAGGSEDKGRPKFSEEHRVLWTDLGKIIGRQGLNLKIIKASIGCNINVPRKGGKKGGKGSGAKGESKGKGKDKGKDKAAVRRGIGAGEKLEDDDFATVVFTGNTLHQARGGKRCVEVMLGYGRSVEAALTVLGIEMKMPSLEELAGGSKKDAPVTKDGIDPMDPASYSDAPVGVWGAGLKKPGEAARGGGQKGKGRGGPQPPPPQDASTANAERF